jgi:hypothetical protein
MRSVYVYNRGDHNAARKAHVPDLCHWCGSRKLPVKNNIQVIYMHTRWTVNGGLKGKEIGN